MKPGTSAAPAVELSPAELGAWRGMLRVHAALFKALDSELEAGEGLPLTSYEVLMTLAQAPGRRLRMAELADRALLSRSGMTRLVDRLAREGLLAREDCPSDGRGCFAALTPSGLAAVQRARPAHLDGVRERFLRHFAPEELETLARWWDRVLPDAAASPQDFSLSDT